jgi:Helix-turn-helix domain
MNEDGSLRMAKALSHPVRIQILTAMNTPPRRMSPKQFSEETGTILSNTSYHFLELKKAGYIKIVDEVQRRGSVEHHYEAVKRALAWTEESKRIPPVILNAMAASTLGEMFMEAGRAIDEGTFDERPERVLAWGKARVDEVGWKKYIRLMNSTLKQAMAIEEECAERLGDNPGIVVSYPLALFESPPPPEPA